MAENPVVALVRLVGGVALMQGRLGHQVLGQMLVAGSSDVAIAGASLLIAASGRERNAVKQVTLRVAAPALAVRGLLHKQEQRIERRATILAERQRRIDSRAEAVERREAALRAQRSAAEIAKTAEVTALEQERADLKAELERLSKRLRAAAKYRRARAPKKTTRRSKKRRRK